MNKVEVEINKITEDRVYKTTLNNGLRVFVCPRKDYTKKMGMFGTVFGSIDNELVDIDTHEKVKVPDGIAHFLEHKLFEQEDANALDVFSKMGVDSNAYTSFDQTVYYFETSDNYEECLDKLIEFVSSPYFTDENVEKEKGIIAQEIKMYEDEPNAVVYYNLLRCMYQNHPINIDIAGTVETISKIDKETLYRCYYSNYNLKNMFLIIIGDVMSEEIIEKAEKIVDKYYTNRKAEEIKRNDITEPEEIAKKEIEAKLPISMPIEMIGFKIKPCTGKDSIKATIIADIINEVCFSTSSDFYEKLYQKGIVISEPDFAFESGRDFSHALISSYVLDDKKFEEEVKEYITNLKENGIDQETFDIMLKKKKGELIYNSEKLSWIYRSVIESIIQDVDVYDEVNILNTITKQDVDNFIKENLDFDKMCVSKVLGK